GIIYAPPVALEQCDSLVFVNLASHNSSDGDPAHVIAPVECGHQHLERRSSVHVRRRDMSHDRVIERPEVLGRDRKIGRGNPSAASTSSRAPSAIFSTRSTSPPKSAWPGVSMMFTLVPPSVKAMFFAKIVMPRSRSRSLESRMHSPRSSLSRNRPDCRII